LVSAALLGSGLALILTLQSAGGAPAERALRTNPLYLAAVALNSGVPYLAYTLAGVAYARSLPGPWKPSVTECLNGGAVTGLITGAVGGLALAGLSMLANWLTYVIAQQEPVADIVVLGGGTAIAVGVFARAVAAGVVGGAAGALTAQFLPGKR
jgi:hypothetical protein